MKIDEREDSRFNLGLGLDLDLDLSELKRWKLKLNREEKGAVKADRSRFIPKKYLTQL